MRLLKLAILGLAAYGGYTLWNQYGSRLQAPANGATPPADSRVFSRSELNVTEWAVGSDDPVAQAAAILADSDARMDLPPDTPGVERRKSQDTVEQ
jgi:hypothetical protein